MNPDFIGYTHRQIANRWRESGAAHPECREYYSRVADLVESGMCVVDATFAARLPTKDSQ